MKGRKIVKNYTFVYDERLTIEIPYLNTAWEELSIDEQKEILFRWEHIRATIPDQIKRLEIEVHALEKRLQIEDNQEQFIALSKRITELASQIIDLNLWFRTHEDITAKVHS